MTNTPSQHFTCARPALFATRLLCAATALAWLMAPGLAGAQPLPEASAASPSVPDAVAVPSATPAPELASDPAYPPVPVSASNPDSTLAADWTPRPLRVMYSPVGMHNSVTQPVMNNLRIVGKSSTRNLVAQQVAINVALMVFTGGLALGVRPFSKESLAGDDPQGAVDMTRLVNPALFQLPAELEKRSAAWLAGNQKARGLTFARPLIVTTGGWRLVYDSLLATEETYRLTFNAGVYKNREKPSFITGSKQAGKGCEYVSEPRALTDWQANDYLAVSETVPLVVDKCSAEFAAQLTSLLEID